MSVRMQAVCLAGMSVILASAAFGGGELAEGGYVMPPAHSSLPAPRAIQRSAIRPLYRPGDEVSRNLPLPAPYHAPGSGAELNDFYGPTYYYPERHNRFEGLNPTYYPSILPPQKAANYKVPGTYCPGIICGSSRSHWYWDSYDDWKRGGRYEQHQ